MGLTREGKVPQTKGETQDRAGRQAASWKVSGVFRMRANIKKGANGATASDLY